MDEVRQPTGQPEAMARAARAIRDLSKQVEELRAARREPIAIVGMACRFPGGANSPEAYWRMLAEGREGTSDVPADRWDREALYDPNPDAPGKMYTVRGGFLDVPVDRFDAAFFHLSPREATTMDPQHRLLLELAWESIEDAGIAPGSLAGSRTGVYVGISTMDYGLLGGRDGAGPQIDAYTGTGNAFSAAAGRISHLLGLTGPSLSLDTACSSSLVAVTLAMQGLRSGLTDAALVGGVNLMLHPASTLAMCRLRALSPSGTCRTFDAGADGYVRGEGGGVVLLRRLSDALEAGDPIHAVIRGAAVNHGGRSSALTVPNPAAQRSVIRAALEDAGVEPGEVDFVEAHGTGTELGDPIEIRVLDEVFGAGHSEEHPLTVASVKTNFGHLEAAAGVAGLMKLALSLEHGQIPPHLHMETPSPYIPWASIPILIPTDGRPWPSGEKARFGGVSSFGITGTNAHLILEEAPARRPAEGVRQERPVHLLPLSARTGPALGELAGHFEARLDDPSADPADLCFTAGTGRSHLERRSFAIGRTREELQAGLRRIREEAEVAEKPSPAPSGDAPRIVFLFPGQGAQKVGMGRTLFDQEPAFRRILESCDEISRTCMDRPLLSVLYPDLQSDVHPDQLLTRTEFAQPAIFAVECALAALWRSWGLEPSIVIGHSLGEFAAAHAAGAVSLEGAFRLVVERGRLMQQLSGAGGMALLLADPDRIAPLIEGMEDRVALAGVNAPGQTVLSGERTALDEALAILSGARIKHHRLEGSIGFHSPVMDPVLEDLEAAASRVRWQAPRIRMISTLTGGSITAADISAPAYWRRQARQPVRFLDAVRSAHELGGNTFLEVGPGSALTGSARRGLPGDAGLTMAPSLRDHADEVETVLSTLGELYARGASVDWRAFHDGFARRRISLPTYPFQRKRYWAFAARAIPTVAAAPADTSPPSLPEPAAQRSWLYSLGWTPSPRADDSAARPTAGRWIILADRGGVGAQLAEALEATGAECTLVHPGDAATNDGALLDLLRTGANGGNGASPSTDSPLRGIVHLWNLDLPSPSDAPDAFERMEREGCTSLMGAAAALEEATVDGRTRENGEQPRVWLVTRGARVLDDQGSSRGPAILQAPALGIGRVLAIESPGIWGGMIDLDPDPAGTAESDLVSALVSELTSTGGQREVAFRSGTRHEARLVPSPAPADRAVPDHPPAPNLRPDATYLVTGGLGSLGLKVAEWLVAHGARHLALLSRTGLTAREAGESPIESVRALEAAGASVLTPSVDVADEESVLRFLGEMKAAGAPPIRGVVHAAGTLRAGPLADLDPASLREVMRPKVHGSWVLHRLLDDSPLDFFVLFSSMAAMTGGPGLGSYAAANGFLDALALHRRAEGKVAVSIAWGPWADGGMVDRTAASERMRWSRLGVEELAPEEALNRLGELMAGDAVHVGVLAAPPEVLGAAPGAASPRTAATPRTPDIGGTPDIAGTPGIAGTPDISGTPGISLLERLAATPPEGRPGVLTAHLRREAATVLLTDLDEIATDRNAVELGMDSIMVMELAAALDRDIGVSLFPREIFERPSLEALAEYLLDLIELPESSAATAPTAAPPATVVISRPLEPVVPAGPYTGPRCPGVVLLLSSPRSGSTLLRVMLEGHPELFCPPELHLLPFAGMADRRARLAGSHLDEGLPRGLMKLLGTDADEASRLVAGWIEEDLAIPEVYLRLRQLLGDGLLVDKSPTYGSSPAILERAESIFEDVRYIHLVRHPHAVIESFARNRFDRLVGAQTDDPAALAEEVWAATNANILDHLAALDPSRFLQLRYEELVRDPRSVLDRVTSFLGVPFTPELLEPYEGDRMTDGLQSRSMGIGDPNLLRHKGIDPSLADAWMERGPHRRLGAFARRVARELAYDPEPPEYDPGSPEYDPGSPESDPESPKSREASTEPRAALRPLRRSGDLPLSFAQERLYFLEQLDPGSATYIIPFALRLRGRLDPLVLEEALDHILERHESLRTVFVTENGRPLQRVRPHTGFELAVEDLAALPREEADAVLRNRALDVQKAPFDLERDTMLRVRLVRLGAEEHVLLIAMHHIAADGTSLDVFLRELNQAYARLGEGGRPELSALPIQYADYAGWQREWLRGETLERQLSYWRKQLEGAPTLELPTDHPRPLVQSSRGEEVPITLSPEASRELRLLAAGEGATPFMALLAAFNVLLGRYSGQDDIVVGSPIAGRSRPETAGLIGFFVNSLVLRTRLDGDPSFREVLERVREVTLEAYAHQDIPFEKLVEELRPARDLSRTPLFQILFNWLPDRRLKGTTFGDARMEWMPEVEPAAKFDLTIYAADGPEGIELRWVYNADLFDRATIERMGSHYRTLLEAVLADPEAPVARVPLLAPDERDRILVEWNRTEVDRGPSVCTHVLFEEQVDRVPDRIAVEAGAVSLTYAELERRANRLAHHLLERGVGPAVRVGICTDRSVDLIVALLGVHKAGGAYVPLDPELPADRLSFLLEDAGIAVLLTQQALADRLPPHGIPTLWLDEDDAELAAQLATYPGTRPEVAVEPDQLSHLIYTSGSTGRPKGVQILHRGVVNVLRSFAHEPGFTEQDTLLSTTTFGFDIGGLELLLPLVTGGRVVLVPREVATDGRQLAAALQQSGATVMQATPSGWRLLLESGWEGKSDLRMISGGEPLPRDLAHALLERGAELWNGYGPSETTIYSTLQRILPTQERILIGRPVDRTQVYVLDRAGEPVPIGVTGELWIAGSGVSRGYLDRPELTAERFVARDLDGTGPRTLYGTGDLARWTPDGRLEHLGRSDDQLKIRGYRIEPGEIEVALLAHEAVGSAAVLPARSAAAHGSAGDATNAPWDHLVAFLVPAPGHALPGAAALREHLAASLPPYMLPARYVPVAEFPRTPNGKLDRNALRELDRAAPGTPAVQRESLPPRTPEEALVAGAFAEVLGLDGVAVHDDFFELGGHSLVATQVLSRIRSALGVELPVRALFEGRTVAALAADVALARRDAVATGVPEMQRLPREGELALSFAQQRLWFLERLEPGGTAYSIPGAVRIHGALDSSALERSLAEVVRRHESLRTTIGEVDGRPIQVIHTPDEFRLEVEDLRELPAADREEVVQRRIAEETARPFDLARGPLFRALLLQLSEQDHVLFLNMHHIVSDGWSLGLLASEVDGFYSALLNGDDPARAELPVQYADYAAWQREWLQGEVLDRQIAYWREQLAGLPTLALPTDRPRPPVQTDRAGVFSEVLTDELSDRLRRLSTGEAVTPFMTLLAAFNILLGRYSGQDDIVVGSPIAGRTRRETEELIGFFVNSLVLRTRLDGDPSFREVLDRVREVTLEAYAHQDLPFEKLVEELRPPRDASRSPLFQVMFNMLPARGADPVTLGEARMEWIPEVHPSAKFDLTVNAADGPEGIELRWVYNADLFDRAAIERMGSHYRTLLEAVLAEPEAPVARLPLLAPDERDRILVEWNRTEVDRGPSVCTHVLFEEQADRVPERTAVEAGGVSLTYAELERRANRLAHHLLACGVGPEVRVGICTDRSVDLVVALLGVHKAGGAYVPLDPKLPADRLSFLLEDAGIAVLLTQQALADRLPPHGIPTLWLDAELAAQLAAYPDTRREVAVEPDHLSHLIYTSGSTGRPKGVQILHRGVVNVLRSFTHEPGFTDRDTLLSTTTFGFDIGGLELLLPLVTGGRVVLVPREIATDGRQLASALQQSGATVMQATPSGWRLLLESGWEGKSDLRMISGGEPLPRDLAHALLERGSELWNGYGPSETTIYSTLQRILPTQERILIGRPVDRTQVYVLDRVGEPVPVGVTGELWIAGAGVSRGYLERPELTAERFVTRDLDGTGPRTLYGTGDLARWTPDGRLEHLGRSDDQLKIRGYRIEPGEIEVALLAHEAVGSAAVLPARSAPAHGSAAAARAHVGDAKNAPWDHLVAFLVPAPGHALPGAAALREHLAATLPSYMLPARYVPVAEFPRSPNGKLDRSALRELDRGATQPRRTASPPTTPHEKILAGIWRELLQTDSIDLEDNFYDLGGHSMLAMQAVARIEEATGVEMGPRQLGLQTLRQLAATCEAASTGAAPSRQPHTPGPRSLFHRILARLRPPGRTHPER